MNGTITFFYYDDMRAALEFYERVVGLRQAADLGWCALLELQPRSFLGLVDAAVGSQHPIAGRNKGTLLSIEAADLEACLARFQRLGVTEASTKIVSGCRGLTREFRIHDPGDYPVEFFTWLTPPVSS